mgnify:CR=1 FL=1|tara:strand:+ start:67296 stop:67556 length:261 start_codon:yes stop_codon:yes gene_type:complete
MFGGPGDLQFKMDGEFMEGPAPLEGPTDSLATKNIVVKQADIPTPQVYAPYATGFVGIKDSNKATPISGAPKMSVEKTSRQGKFGL